MKDAIAQSEKRYATQFRNLVYFGDGAWDFKTCHKVGLPFIGVDYNSNGKLKQLGASRIIESFDDQEFVCELITRA